MVTETVIVNALKRKSDQSSGSLVVKTLASHASGRGFDAPGGLSSKKFPLGGSQNVCDAGSPCYEALASD